ncbi:MAG: O-antigen ligase family protein [Ruminococcaceae bacterium]|nr:O-antigen ligase family protein [Oscillospiraceae bacterium]
MTRILDKYKDLPFHKRLDRFALSPLAFAIQFFLACLIVILDFQINGVAIFGFIGIGMLVLCSDLLSICLPILLCSVFATALYDSAEKFLSFIIPEAVLIVLSVIFHFLVYGRKKLMVGKSFWGLLAVSAAITLSGIGSISPREYFAPSALYYTFFLGFGLLAVYVIINTYFDCKRDYDVFEKFAIIMYFMGIFACFNILNYYIDSIQEFISSPGLVTFQAANNLSTFLMFALPFPFYFAIKKSKLHLVSAFLMYVSLVLSGSGGGFLMGSVMMLLCVVYMAVYDKKWRVLWIAVLSVGTVCGIILFGHLLSVYNFASFEDIFYSNNFRIALFRRSLGDFAENPIFGAGLTHRGNTDIYNPKAGAMTWYHMMLPQIWGSMGIVGLAAYGFNLYKRGRMILEARRDLYSMTLGMSYIGLFLMSQVNPGEFCPIPYALLAVLIFIFIERKPKDHIPFNKN